MAYALNEVLDYVAYAHARNQSFPYVDFVADGLKVPQKLRDGAVVFPNGWADAKRLNWRRRHKLTIPDKVVRDRRAPYEHAPVMD
jgi:hypothetical protein